MDVHATLVAAFLGVVEGFTEFLPVSSTGHLLLFSHFLGFRTAGRTFEVLIQLGAILAVVTVYFARLVAIFLSLPASPRSRRFVAGILVAFLPAAAIGVLAHGFIKEVLFETPAVVCAALVVGGIVLLVIDKLPLEARHRDVMDYPLSLCLKIGLFQCLALVPGTSRSGATIVGALLMGADKRSAAEFTFFLAMPTMAGAFAYDLYQNRDVVGSEDLWLIAVGFVFAFIAALAVVRTLLPFVARHGYAPFAWWRIVVGTLGLAALFAFG